MKYPKGGRQVEPKRDPKGEISIWWNFWQNVDGECGEAKIFDLDLTIQDSRGDFSFWHVRRSGKHLAAGNVYPDQVEDSFEAARDICTRAAYAIIEADQLNAIEVEQFLPRYFREETTCVMPNKPPTINVKGSNKETKMPFTAKNALKMAKEQADQQTVGHNSPSNN